MKYGYDTPLQTVYQLHSCTYSVKSNLENLRKDHLNVYLRQLRKYKKFNTKESQ